MPLQQRSFWLGAGALVYVLFAAIETGGLATGPLLGMGALPLVLALTWRRTQPNERGDDPQLPEARVAARACVWGACLWVAARTGPAGAPSFDAVANLGLATSSVAALVALARIASMGGLLTAPQSTRSLDAAVFAALLWAVAITLPGARFLSASDGVLVDPLAIDYATTTASIGALLVMIASSWRIRAARRLELGVADRAAGALALTTTAFMVAVPATAADVAAPDRVLPVAVLFSALCCVWTVMTREPTLVSTLLRGTVAVMALGVPTTLVTAVLVRGATSHAATIALGGAVASLVVGLIARSAARPLGPEQSRWLEAVDAASRGALQPEPDAAIVAALAALRATATHPGARPELWRLSPPEVLTVDVAGYLHTERTEAPARLWDIALEEPERTLRADTLGALEVRRPDLRPMLAWFRARHAFSATVVVDEDGPIGFLLLPRGSRVTPMTLEEARAVRVLADRLSALLAVSSALARSRERELEAKREVLRLGQQTGKLTAQLDAQATRHRALAELFARPVIKSCYSAAARATEQDLTRLGRDGEPIAVVAPPGTDALGFAAIAHLAGEVLDGPFFIVQCGGGAARDPESWLDEVRSPVVLAAGGTLVLVDLPTLPIDAQDALGRRLALDSVSGDSPSVRLIAVLREPPHLLTERRQLARGLSPMLCRNVVTVPTLAERPEDLRALIFDGLIATGARHHGEPLGVEHGALGLLLDHPWPGNETELTAVLVRAAAVATGPLITAADLASAGFVPIESAVATLTPLPEPARTRRRPRRPRH